MDYDYRQLIGQITGRIATKNGALLQEWLNQYCNVAITCLIPNPGVFLRQKQPASFSGGIEPNSPSGTESKETCISAIYRLASDHHAAALSTVKNEMTLWDFRTGHRDKGDQPTDIFSLSLSLSLSAFNFDGILTDSSYFFPEN